MPFGPDHGDAFATREGCSLGVDLEQNFKIGNQRIDTIYACLDGVLKFITPVQIYESSVFGGFNWIDYPIVAPFLANHGIEN